MRVLVFQRYGMQYLRWNDIDGECLQNNPELGGPDGVDMKQY